LHRSQLRGTGGGEHEKPALLALARDCSQLNNGYGLEKATFSTGTVKKSMARPLETQAHFALELFAPELIHESRNCSNVHSLPRIPEENRYSFGKMSSSEL
jgi:hypothetical protein